MWHLRAVVGLLAVGSVLLVITALRQPDISPIEIRSSVSVILTPQQAWQRLSDLSVAHNYVPGVVRTEVISSNSRGLGASRRVYSSATEFINETVTAWDAETGFTLRLHDDEGRAPMPFQSAEFSYRIDGSVDETTTIVLSLSFVVRGGVFGDWLVRNVMTKTLQDRVDRIATRLKDYWE